jgi:hypothetical protein
MIVAVANMASPIVLARSAGVEEGAGGKFANLAFVDRRVREDELVEVLEDREFRAGDAITDRPRLSVRALGADQTDERRIEFIRPGNALAGDLVEAGAHAEVLGVALLDDLLHCPRDVDGRRAPVRALNNGCCIFHLCCL